MRNDEKITRGYLYTYRNDEMMMYEGEAHSWNVKVFEKSEPKGCFHLDQPTSQKCYSCASEPGVVLNRTVWLTEPDDLKAAKLFAIRLSAEIRPLEKELRKKKLSHAKLMNFIFQSIEKK